MNNLELLFLDIDGVLNNHVKKANGYCGINPEPVQLLNAVLDTYPSLQLVISSAWRNIIYKGESTLVGFEHLLLTHGIKCYKRLHGVTGVNDRTGPQNEDGSFDVEAWYAIGLEMRPLQILAYVDEHKPTRWLAVDDLALDLPIDHFVKTDGNKGLMPHNMLEMMLLLGKQNKENN